MLGRSGRRLPELCADLSDAVLRLDERASTASFGAVVERVEHADEQELTEGVTRLAPALEKVALGNGGLLAGLVAGLIESGADPRPVLGVLVERVADGLERAAQFAVLADKLGDGLAAPRSVAEHRALQDLIERVAPAAFLTVAEAEAIIQAWFTVNGWIPSLLVPLQQKRARLALPQRDRLTGATAAVTDRLEDAPWLLGLLLVLDDEPFLVAHRETGRAYELTVGGVGDNFQLHTLLAALLIGDPEQGLLPGEPPEPAWVAAATTGEMAPAGGIAGRFDLVDAAGEPIWNEGRPAAIPVVEGRRVVILDPPSHSRTWNLGRVYPLMSPEVTLDRIIPA
jgi:hypothetical protein